MIEKRLSLQRVCQRTGFSRAVILSQVGLPFLEVEYKGKKVRRYRESDVTHFIERHLKGN